MGYMLIMFKIFCYWFAVGAFFVLSMILGEWICGKLPNSKFTKFWRKNIVAEGEDFE